MYCNATFFYEYGDFMRTLNDIIPGQHAIIQNINTENNMKRRLLDIGLIKGTKVKCLGQSPFGDPKAFLIRGSVIAIRNEDLKTISIN